MAVYAPLETIPYIISLPFPLSFRATMWFSYRQEKKDFAIFSPYKKLLLRRWALKKFATNTHDICKKKFATGRGSRVQVLTNYHEWEWGGEQKTLELYFFLNNSIYSKGLQIISIILIISICYFTCYLVEFCQIQEDQTKQNKTKWKKKRKSWWDLTDV